MYICIFVVSVVFNSSFYSSSKDLDAVSKTKMNKHHYIAQLMFTLLT